MKCLQAQISQFEHSHTQHLLEVTARHHQELDLETDRLRVSQLQAEQALESREKAHRQRVKCLEEQVFSFYCLPWAVFFFFTSNSCHPRLIIISVFPILNRCWLSKSSWIWRQEDGTPISVRCHNLVCRQRSRSEVCSTSGVLVLCSSGSSPATLRYKLRPHLEVHMHTRTHSRGIFFHSCMCTQDYINL